ncbi:MAG: PQQ-like beta-propeller repeat protein [Planctomycetia bacterium]|nr:PQQ-like beta-propeller repeat protein [Planctomycetia bacterium]
MRGVWAAILAIAIAGCGSDTSSDGTSQSTAPSAASGAPSTISTAQAADSGSSGKAANRGNSGDAPSGLGRTSKPPSGAKNGENAVPDEQAAIDDLAKQKARENSPVVDEPPPSGPPPKGDLRTRKTGSDWPRFLGPTGDSKSSEKGILTKWPAKGPKIVWQRRLGEGYGAPTINRGRLYEFSRFGDTARCTCLKSETGEPLWRFEYATDYVDPFQYSGGPRCCPVVDEDRVYLLGAEGMLHCLDAETGEVRWKLDTIKKFGVAQNFFGVGGSPVVDGELLIVMIGGSPPESQDLPPGALDHVKGNGSGVVAFDKKTGKVVYQITDELASYASPVLADIAGRRWCFVFARGGLVGFEPQSGKVDFHFPWRANLLESVNASNPVVVGNRVLISETYGPGSALVEVEPGACRAIWTDAEKGRNKSLQTHWNTPIYVDGHVYASSGRHSNGAGLRCVEWNTGKVAWQADSVPFRDPIDGEQKEALLSRSSLLYADGHFVCLTEFGLLLLIRATPEKFDPAATAYLLEEATDGPRPLIQYPAWAAPVLSHGLLYIRGKGRLVCLELIPEVGSQ